MVQYGGQGGCGGSVRGTERVWEFSKRDRESAGQVTGEEGEEWER